MRADGELVVLDGSTFFVSDRAGDVAGPGPGGFFHADTRHLSQWQLLVAGSAVRVLTSRTVDYYSARIVATLAGAAFSESFPVSLRRDRIVADGVHEDVVVTNHSGDVQRFSIELRFGSDFADLFEVRDELVKRGRTWTEVDQNDVVLRYENETFKRATRLSFSESPLVENGAARFDLTLAPRDKWSMCIDISCTVDGEERGPRAGHGGFGSLHPDMPLSLDEWLADAPKLDTDCDVVRHTYHQSLLDLAALRFRPFGELRWSLPAAGLPWFMTVFGRDSLLTAYMALPFQPRLAATTLEALASLQASDYDDFRDAEPGKILHELRRGELTALGKKPHSPYYGSHDATPLFLILLDEYERWTGDVKLVRELEGVARAAMSWVEGAGDPDGDGYLEYQTRSAEGLVNQCWKDSWDSIRFADGNTAVAPVATCEIQGYAYDARRRVARLARTVWLDDAWADELEAGAARLAQRFDRDFWCPLRGHHALALDGDKRRVDSLTSNIGHLLWSGVVLDDRAAQVALRLLDEDMASGWGIRTMSSGDAAYSPISYHNGTVWPHDTALVAEGLRRYGFRAEASALAFSLFEAAEQFEYRLPEVFAGFARSETAVTVEYPTAASPQAWSAAAPLLALRVILGLDPVDAQLAVEPALPDGVGTLRLRGVPFRGDRIDVG